MWPGNKTNVSREIITAGGLALSVESGTHRLLTGYWSDRYQNYLIGVCVKTNKDIDLILFASSSLSLRLSEYR